MYSSYLRMGGKALLGGLLTALIAALTLAPVGVAQAAAGTFEWCPSPAGHDDTECVPGGSFQDAVLKAQAAHVPGTVYVNAGTFFGNVVVTGLQNVIFTGNADSGSGTTINGNISILNSKNITVTGFTVSDGISVEKGSGAYQFLGNTGTLAVKTSTFDHNTVGSGLFISHAGDVSLMRVSASRNHNHGFWIGTTGDVLLIDVTAGKNGQMGAFVGSSSTVTVSTVNLKVNRFDQNGTGGLTISAAGAITLFDVNANKNGDDGMIASGGATVTVGTARSKVNRFDGNSLSGLQVSVPGNVTLTDVSASKNGAYGLVSSSGAIITINTANSKVNQFDRNTLIGLRVSTPADITLTDVSASKNGQDGLNASSGDAVIVNTNNSKMNKFDRNGLNGVTISAAGNAVVIDGSANSNGVDGAHLSGDIVAIGTNKAKALHFDKNAGDGVYVSTPGIILLSDLNASRNGSDGVHLNSGGTVTMFTNASKLSRFERNGGYGIYASTPGAIGLRDVSASRNDQDGARLSSGDAVTITTTNSKLNSFDNNKSQGLYISASGIITVNDVSASKNLQDGAYLSSSAAVSVGTVHAKTNKFDSNTGNGIGLSAGDDVTIANSSASKNKAYGLYLSTSNDPVSVTCSAVKKNTSYDIRAGLGSANMFLGSVTLTHAGLVDVDFTGSGVIIVSTVACS